jgi:glycosyltransferase involved in cell wall biosynthesis
VFASYEEYKMGFYFLCVYFFCNIGARLKILHLIDTLRSGGKERQLVEVLKFFSQQKKIFSALVVMSNDIHYDYLEKINVKIYKILRKRKNDVSVFLRFYKVFRDWEPDIVHSWSSMCSVYAVPGVVTLKIKFVNNFLRSAPPNLKLTNKEWRRAKLTFPFSDIIAANSHAGLKAYNVPLSKRVCLHNGFDFRRVEDLDSKESVRNKFEVHTNYVVGMVGTFSENRDHQTFIDAAQIVLEKRKDITFFAIGDGDYFETIKMRIKPQFREFFRLPGKLKRIMNIVNIFDIGILATNTRVIGEGIPNAVMEYMALKKPVIVTDCGGNRELVEDKITGYLVAPENPILLSQKILFLLENGDLAVQFGLNGYKKLIQEFNLQKMGNNFLKVYRGYDVKKNDY